MIKQDVKKNSWCKMLFAATLAIFVVTLSAQIYLTNSLALKSKDLRDLALRKEKLEKDIARLEFEDAALSSLSYIEKQAHDHGFITMRDPINTLKPVSVAAITVSQQ